MAAHLANFGIYAIAGAHLELILAVMALRCPPP
jgi:hypothetical protein